MGMDVYGKKEGEHFFNNVAGWHPLADYIEEVAPDIASKCRYWHSNDGDGLGAADARKLADVLQAEIDSGRCDLRARARAAVKERMPKEPCWLCDGTGRRHKPFSTEIGFDPVTGVVCEMCKGEALYPSGWSGGWFSVQNVQDFVAFLRGCGGFKIW
jgi:hypothetical protein